HARKGCQLVDARRRRLRRRDPAYRDRQDPEDGAAGAIQGFHPAECCRRTVKPLVTPPGAIHRGTLAFSRPDAVRWGPNHRGLLQESERMPTVEPRVSAATAA